jgi:hypothetical protein
MNCIEHLLALGYQRYEEWTLLLWKVDIDKMETMRGTFRQAEGNPSLLACQVIAVAGVGVHKVKENKQVPRVGVVLQGDGRVAGKANQLVATGSNAEKAPRVGHCLHTCVHKQGS